jgi:hypothetical protein
MELELQAMVWAIRKCQVFLMALNEFVVYTDHRDLAGLETRALEPSPNNRLLRNKEYLLSFPLTVKYLPKEQNLIADWLSRKPQPTEIPGLLPRFETGTVALVYEGLPLDKKLLDLIEVANQDDAYCSILQVLNEGGDLRGLRADHPAREYRSQWQNLSTFNGPNGQCILCDGRIVVPHALRHQYLADLHHHHPSSEPMWFEARAKIFWPGLKGEIKNLVDSCLVCQEIHRMHYEPPPILVNQDLASVINPMDELRVDWGSAGRRHFHVVVDLATSYLWVRVSSDVN